MKKQVAIFVEGPGDSQEDSAAASQDGFVKQKIMETIFDHKVTEDELKWLLNRPYTLEEYLNLGGSVNDHFVHIAKLYYHRGKKYKAKRYINKVTNPNLRNSYWRTVSHMNNATQHRNSFSFVRLLKKLKKNFS